MSAFWTLVKRELTAIFLSPIAYICGVVFLVCFGYFFCLPLEQFTKTAPDFALQELVAWFFGNALGWFILILLVTAVTMRLFAEEKRNGTIEALLTAPVTDLQVVMAKFLGAFLFYAMLWMPTLFFFLCLGLKGLDLGLLASAYLGVLLIGALFISIGCLTSSLCRSQMVAAILCFFALSVASFAPVLLRATAIDSELFMECVAYVSLFPAGPHSLMGDMNRGLVTVTHLAYPLSTAACCLFLTCKVMESRSWK